MSNGRVAQLRDLIDAMRQRRIDLIARIYVLERDNAALRRVEDSMMAELAELEREVSGE